MEFQALREIYDRYRSEVESTCLEIHAHPELSEEEFRACKIQMALLEGWGFSVEGNYKGLPTAFAATHGEGHPHICIMSEYDALPGMGHGCGHNLIAGTALATGIILKTLMEEKNIPGRLTVMGTPAEEKRGCKVDLIQAGALEDVDLVLMAHPSDHPTAQSTGSSGIMQFEVHFTGRESHAADAPEQGLNALDAVRLLFNGVDCWRQQLPETCRIHGIISQGGQAPNIIPGKGVADFYLRSFEMDYLESMAHRFKNMARGAALMTDTQVEVRPIPHTYKPTRSFDTLNKTFMDLARTLEMYPKWMEPGRGSSDFGDVTHEVPGAHVYFNITQGDPQIVLHSKEFTQCAATPFALTQMEKMGLILARMGHRFFTDKDFQGQVREDFHGK
ncbi:MAG: M20 family metallopeptidase [Desulfobacterales bacterium]|nr:M20 family metallopeptidase [Desulfobacterales bacterium]